MDVSSTQAPTAVAEATAIGFYLVYAVVAVGLVIYLAKTLRANGAVFLENVFDDEKVAAAVNHLLVIGFYLLNLGYAFLLYQLDGSYPSLTDAFNQLVVKIGALLLSLGVIHLANMFVFWRIRTHRSRERGPVNRPLSFGALPPPPIAANTAAPASPA